MHLDNVKLIYDRTKYSAYQSIHEIPVIFSFLVILRIKRKNAINLWTRRSVVADDDALDHRPCSFFRARDLPPVRQETRTRPELPTWAAARGVSLTLIIRP